MAVGWACPRCPAVMGPHVAEHRCDPPTAGVTTVGPQPPWPAPVGIAAPNVTVTYPDTWTVTTGTSGPATARAAWLAAVPDTDAMPPRPEITESAV